MRFKKRTYYILLPAFSLLSLFMILSSCSYKHYEGFEKVEISEITLPYLFEPAFSKANYLTYFDVLGNQLSGITIIKRNLQSNTFHVVFMSQLGLKYFDLEMDMEDESNGFRLNYILESLNRDFIIDALANDLKLLFVKFKKDSNLQLYKHPKENTNEITINDGKKLASYIIKNNEVQYISFKKGSSNIASIFIKEFNTIYPQKLEMINKKAHLKIIMNEINLE